MATLGREVNFEEVQDMIKRRMKVGKTHLIVPVPSPEIVEAIGEWYAALPGFRSELHTKIYHSEEGEEFRQYLLKVDWAVRPPAHFTSRPELLVERYSAQPTATTLFKVSYPAYTNFGVETFDLP